jgi:HK97 family phage prohead protease
MHNHSDQLDTQSVPEIRSFEGGRTTIFGYWAKFDSRSRVMTTPKGVKFVEEIRPGAFDNTDFSDVQCLFNHDPSRYLSSEPSLRYGVDSTGAWYEFDYDAADPEHVSLLRKLNRSEVKGSSFQFKPLPAHCYSLSMVGGMRLRTITIIPAVVEFGPVIVPAYNSTTAFARSLDQETEEVIAEAAETATEVAEVVVEVEAETAEAVQEVAETESETAEAVLEAETAENIARKRTLSILNSIYPPQI